ncbi:MAG: DNA mismatch repair endonuclease MutL [Deltaproteobacteria bacterium]|nr:DNA mismatch repair endonuclease MutL [Deltaproteobacteria bacterium]
MPGRIRSLTDDVVNRIAAGEVVERPASVLKELLENAVDSGAGNIEAQVSGPFPFTLRVTDDGCGMTRDEAELSLRRHTTSKIASADDLERIGSFGFRGEALPSIASVARLTLVTRPPGQAAATEVTVEGGAVRSVRDAGAPPGTTVTVSGLFGNVPARRKFLKSERTESSHLREVFHGVAIPGEGVSFRYADSGGSFSYESRESAPDRARRHAGDDGQYLVPVDISSAFFRVFGWAGLPQISRSGAGGLWFFINGRRFRDRGLYAAVREAYRGILPADRLPTAYLFITCSPAEADVNVHPAKTEVRFRYPRDLHELARHAFGRALGESPLPSDIPQPFTEWGSSSARPFGGNAWSPPAPLPFLAAEDAQESFFRSLRPVGQLLGTYLVCEGADAMILIDQHAADERIVFSRLKERYLGRNAPVQQWLQPVEAALPGILPDEREVVGSFMERMGFSFESSGEASFRITGGPAALPRFDAKGWWEELCESLRAQETHPKDIFDADRELWRMACHSSLRGGDPVTNDRTLRLLAELEDAVAAHSCPHGRPVWIRIPRARLDALFHRTG